MKLKRWMTVFMTVSSLLLISACNSDNEDSELDYESPVNTTDTVDDSTSIDKYPYTEDELESDPAAPTTSPDDYNSDGKYLPESGPTDNPTDYSTDGEYKPVEEMTQEEVQEELESVLGESVGQ